MAASGVVSTIATLSTLRASLLPLRRTFFTKRTSSLLPYSGPKLTKAIPALRKFVIRAARMESQGVSLGFRAPDFQLPEPLTGKMWGLDDFESYPALLVMFICNHCPFVKHLKEDIVKLANFYMKKGLAVVAISSNSVATHPQDGPEFMAEEAKLFKYPFPYLYDESQEVAKDFGAVCTPEFFLFKKDGRRPFELVYHGQFDDSRPSSNVPITGRDLSLAVDCVLSSQPLSFVQKPRATSWLLVVHCITIRDEQSADREFARLGAEDASDDVEDQGTVASEGSGGISTEVPPECSSQHDSAREMHDLRKSIANQLARRYRMPQI